MDLVEAGKCQIILSTSNDDRFPASNILDGSSETFWISTGLFPQEIIVRFDLDKSDNSRPTLAKISKIQLRSTNIKQLIVSASSKKVVSQFETVMDVQMEEREGKSQVQTINLNDVPAHYLSFQIVSGWDNFVSISSVDIEGTVSENE